MDFNIQMNITEIVPKFFQLGARQRNAYIQNHKWLGLTAAVIINSKKKKKKMGKKRLFSWKSQKRNQNLLILWPVR